MEILLLAEFEKMKENILMGHMGSCGERLLILEIDFQISWDNNV